MHESVALLPLNGIDFSFFSVCEVSGHIRVRRDNAQLYVAEPDVQKLGNVAHLLLGERRVRNMEPRAGPVGRGELVYGLYSLCGHVDGESELLEVRKAARGRDYTVESRLGCASAVIIRDAAEATETRESLDDENKRSVVQVDMRGPDFNVDEISHVEHWKEREAVDDEVRVAGELTF